MLKQEIILLGLEGSIVVGFSGNGDLHAIVMRGARGSRLERLLVADAALAIVLATNPIALLGLEWNGVCGGLRLLEGQDGVGCDVAATAGGDDVGGTAGTRGMRGRGDGEGSTRDERAANREDNAEGHGGGENGSHAERKEEMG